MTWHGVKLGQPDWGESSHSLALEAKPEREGFRVYLILNAYWEPLDFELPTVDDSATNPWSRWIDTSLESPEDIVAWKAAPLLSCNTYRAGARSVVVLFTGARGAEALV